MGAYFEIGFMGRSSGKTGLVDMKIFHCTHPQNFSEIYRKYYSKDFELVREATIHRVDKDSPTPVLSNLNMQLELNKFLSLIVFTY